MPSIIENLTDEELKMIEEDEDEFWSGHKFVRMIGSEAFSRTKISTISIPSSVRVVMNAAFSNCKELERVSFLGHIDKLGNDAFAGCESLQVVENLSTKNIGDSAFEDCRSLKSIDLTNRCKELGTRAFAGCENLTDINFPKVQTINDNCFSGCQSLMHVEFPKSLWSINDHAFYCCTSLETANLPEGLESLGTGVFENCVNLNYVYLPESLVFCGKNVFTNCTRLRHAALNFDESIIFSEQPIQPDERTKVCYDFGCCYDSIRDFDLDKSLFVLDFHQTHPIIEEYIKAAQNASKHGIVLTQAFIKKLVASDQIDVFASLNFDKRFQRIQKKFLSSCSDANWTGLLTFAYDIGCFSENKILSQRANEWLMSRIDGRDLQINQMSYLFCDWGAHGENEEFSNFLFSRDNNTNIPIFNQIRAEARYQDFLMKIYEEYLNPDSEQKRGGRFRNADGKLMFANIKMKRDKAGNEVGVRVNHVPTVEQFKTYFDATPFAGAETAEDFELARELSKWGRMRQQDFYKGKKIMREFNTSRMAGILATNIVGTHLTNFDERVRRYDKQTSQLASEAYSASRDIAMYYGGFQSEFRYDWLEKDSVENMTLGLSCKCCAHLAGAGFGIMYASIIHPDCQNLVIRDWEGTPVAKATAYVNRKNGYLVFNTVQASFDLVDSQLEEVYNQFMLGTIAFVNEYNARFPNKPLKIVTVGIHLNSLEKQFKRIKKQPQHLIGLNFGAFGEFMHEYPGDWSQEGQYVVWEKSDFDGVKNGQEK